MLAVHALERGREPVRVALAPHLAIGHDIDAGALLIADRQHCRVVLRLLEPCLIHAPELARSRARRNDLGKPRAIDQPIRLRVAAHQGGRKQRWALCSGGHEIGLGESHIGRAFMSVTRAAQSVFLAKATRLTYRSRYGKS